MSFGFLITNKRGKCKLLILQATGSNQAVCLAARHTSTVHRRRCRSRWNQATRTGLNNWACRDPAARSIDPLFIDPQLIFHALVLYNTSAQRPPYHAAAREFLPWKQSLSPLTTNSIFSTCTYIPYAHTRATISSMHVVSKASGNPTGHICLCALVNQPQEEELTSL